MASRTFSYTILFDEEDTDIMEEWYRVECAAVYSKFAAKVMRRKGEKKPTPKHTIDHINRNPFDNRRANLRWATRAEQIANQCVYITNTSGHKGVHRNKKDKKWIANFTREGKIQRIGCKENDEGFVECVRWFHEQAKLRWGDDWTCESCRLIGESLFGKVKCSV